jgi:hypothetical protein
VIPSDASNTIHRGADDRGRYIPRLRPFGPTLAILKAGARRPRASANASRGGAVQVARRAHNPEVAGSNPAPATTPQREPRPGVKLQRARRGKTSGGAPMATPRGAGRSPASRSRSGRSACGSACIAAARSPSRRVAQVAPVNASACNVVRRSRSSGRGRPDARPTCEVRAGPHSGWSPTVTRGSGRVPPSAARALGRPVRGARRETGARCTETEDLRACHLTPLGDGGDYSLTNGRMRCRRHDRATDPKAR